jgi:hypothetical protein
MAETLSHAIIRIFSAACGTRNHLGPIPVRMKKKNGQHGSLTVRWPSQLIPLWALVEGARTRRSIRTGVEPECDRSYSRKPGGAGANVPPSRAIQPRAPKGTR